MLKAKHSNLSKRLEHYLCLKYHCDRSVKVLPLVYVLSVGVKAASLGVPSAENPPLMRNTVGKTEGQHPTLNPLTSLGCYQNCLMCFTKFVGFSLKLAPKVHQQIVREAGHICQALVNPSVRNAIFIFVRASILSCQVVILGSSCFPQPYKVLQQHPDKLSTQYIIPKSASVYSAVAKSKSVIPRSFNLWSDQVVLIFPLAGGFLFTDAMVSYTCVFSVI